MVKSTIPVTPTTVNPRIKEASYFVTRQDEIKEMQRTIRTLSEQCRRPHPCENGIVDLEKLKNLLPPGFKERFIQLAKTGLEQPNACQPYPPPPDSKKLYGRFGFVAKAGTKILDVGCGRGSRVQKLCSMSDFTALEPDLEAIKKLRHVPVLNKTLAACVAEDNPVLDARYFTSFNSFTQLTRQEQDYLIARDGCHMMPNLDSSVDDGYSVLMADGRLKTTVGETESGEAKVWYDYPYPEDLPHVKVGHGYIMTTCLTPRVTNFRAYHEVKMQRRAVPKGGPLSAYSDMFNMEDMGVKVDGTLYCLEVLIDGIGYLYDRRGIGWKGTVGFDSIMGATGAYSGRFLVERVLSSHGVELFFLVNFDQFSNDGHTYMCPGHSGSLLRYYANMLNISIHIGDVPSVVLGPLVYDPSKRNGLLYDVGGLGQIPLDGVITRSSEEDYYTKFKWTIDIYGYNYHSLAEYVRGRAYIVHDPVLGDLNDLHELSLRLDGENVVFEFVRVRTDKTEETNNETVLFLIDAGVWEDNYMMGSLIMV